MQQTKRKSSTAIDLFKAYITSALICESGDENSKAAIRCAEKKFALILADLTRIYFSSNEHKWFRDRSEIKVYFSKLYECAWGRISINGKQYWLNSLLKYYLFMVWREGDNLVHSASAIEFKKPVVVNAIKQYAVENPHIFQRNKIVDMGQDINLDYFDTSIDTNSLSAYIDGLSIRIIDEPYVKECAKYKLEGNISESYLLNIVKTKRQKDLHRWKYANELKNELSNASYLRQFGSISNAGRLYFKGINLQNAPKEVRHAALGYSVSYDMRCGALSVFAALAHNFTDGSQKFHVIRDYIKNRHEMRAAITRDLYPELNADTNVKAFHGYQKIKSAFTSIGFGAKKSVTGFWKNKAGNWVMPSLKSILGDRAEMFIEHRLVKDVLKEYEMAANIIYNAYQQGHDFYRYLVGNSVLDSKLNRKQLLAHIYQHFESVILANLLHGAQQQGAKLLLPLHDGAYFDRTFDCKGVCYLMPLPFIRDNSFIQFERSVHCSQANMKTHSTMNGVKAHKKFIEKEEMTALNYTLGSLPLRLPV